MAQSNFTKLFTKAEQKVECGINADGVEPVVDDCVEGFISLISGGSGTSTTTTTTSVTTTTTLGFLDNGDGTITDLDTGLMGEKKCDPGGVEDYANPHDVDNVYSWSTWADEDYTDPDGTVFTNFLHRMNETCDGDTSVPCTDDSDCAEIGNGLCGYAGYQDWRLPEVNENNGLKELNRLVDLRQEGPPYTFNAFREPCTSGGEESACSCTAAYELGGMPAQYWSSVTSVDDPTVAWSVSFYNGLKHTPIKLSEMHVRAVRGGSATLRFVDNGDGKITDNQTGLMWEKKDDAGGIHDVDNKYSWAGCCNGNCSNYNNYCQPNAAAASACSAQKGGSGGVLGVLGGDVRC